MITTPNARQVFVITAERGARGSVGWPVALIGGLGRWF
jgi:hypothetical protein